MNFASLFVDAAAAAVAAVVEAAEVVDAADAAAETPVFHVCGTVVAGPK